MKILFDNGHGIDTPGKRSPDGVLREYARNRLIAGRVVSALTDLGHDPALLVPEQEDIPLSERCRRVNELCRLLGRDNVILISIHTNAAGRGDRWYDATGWCAYTTRGDTLADALATSLYEAAKFHLRASGSAPTTPTATPTWRPTSTFSEGPFLRPFSWKTFSWIPGATMNSSSAPKASRPSSASFPP